MGDVKTVSYAIVESITYTILIFFLAFNRCVKKRNLTNLILDGGCKDCQLCNSCY